MAFDVDDLIESLEEEYNFHSEKETCGNCKQAEWDYSGSGKCVELTNKLKEVYETLKGSNNVEIIPENLVEVWVYPNDCCDLFVEKKKKREE